jgi:hypothetical protein
MVAWPDSQTTPEYEVADETAKEMVKQGLLARQ